MTDLHGTWIRAAAEVTNYRHMYALAAEIAGSETSRDIRRAARRVVRTLEGVIDQPIAEASILAVARRRFGALAEVLQRPDVLRPLLHPAKTPGRKDRAA